MVPPLFTQAGVLYTYVMGCYLDWRMLALSGVSSRVPKCHIVGIIIRAVNVPSRRIVP